MPLIPLDVPPGQYLNGTEYQSQRRWRAGNLIRWHEGALRPVGGWRHRGSVEISGFVRSMLVWEVRDMFSDYTAEDGVPHTKLLGLQNQYKYN